LTIKLAEVDHLAMAEQAKMAAWTYYAYNAPAKMTKSNFATMINSLETTHALPTVSRSTEDNETVLKFDEPGEPA